MPILDESEQLGADTLASSEPISSLATPILGKNVGNGGREDFGLETTKRTMEEEEDEEEKWAKKTEKWPREPGASRTRTAHIDWVPEEEEEIVKEAEEKEEEIVEEEEAARGEEEREIVGHGASHGPEHDSRETAARGDADGHQSAIGAASHRRPPPPPPPPPTRPYGSFSHPLPQFADIPEKQIAKDKTKRKEEEEEEEPEEEEELQDFGQENQPPKTSATK